MYYENRNVLYCRDRDKFFRSTSRNLKENLIHIEWDLLIKYSELNRSSREMISSLWELDFVLQRETAALIADRLRAGYFWGSLAFLELGDGLINFENDNLPGLSLPSHNGPSNGCNTPADGPIPLDLFVSWRDYSPSAIATNYKASFNWTRETQWSSLGTTELFQNYLNQSNDTNENNRQSSLGLIAPE